MVLAFGCGNNGGAGSSGTNGNGSGATNGAGAANGAGGMGASGAPLYAAAHQSFTADGPTTFILVSDSVEGFDGASLTDGVEVGGRAVAVGSPDLNAVFVASTAAPTITRYDIGTEDTLTFGDVVSFAQEGVTQILARQTNFQFISPAKAYWFDQFNAQIIIWNPTEMVVEGTIDLSPLLIEGWQLAPYFVGRRGSEVVFTTGYLRGEANIEALTRSGLLVIDSEDDSIELTFDDRCGDLQYAVQGPDNAFYVASSVTSDAVRLVAPELRAEGCVLRVPDGADEFDPEYQVSLRELVNGRPAGNLLPGPDGTALVWTFDESAFTVEPDTVFNEIIGAVAWQVLQVDLVGEPNPRPLAEWADLATGAALSYEVDGRVFVAQFAPDLSSTALREMTAANPGVRVVEDAPAALFTLTQIRGTSAPRRFAFAPRTRSLTSPYVRSGRGMDQPRQPRGARALIPFSNLAN